MPQVVVDTSGWAFTYPLYRLVGVKVASYTHYPVISTDMLQRVSSRRAAFNNDASVAASPLRSAVKLLYYYLFAAAYGAVGGCANVSSWACSLLAFTTALPTNKHTAMKVAQHRAQIACIGPGCLAALRHDCRW